MKKALIIAGGWSGHEPKKIAQIYQRILEENGFAAEISDTLAAFDDAEKLKTLDLIAPQWTMGEITKEQCKAVSEAVADGVGLAGCHGGLCDAFRNSVLWQFMTGGNWVSHPGGDGVEYTVNIDNSEDSLCKDIADFTIRSEHYYLHYDPAVKVHATTTFPSVRWYHSSNGKAIMPVVWTKMWGAGRVFYTSLGHHADSFDIPEAHEILKRGLLWAGESKQKAREEGRGAADFRSDAKMF